MGAKGIDVSLHQGVINWDAAKASGVSFAVIKASQTGVKEDGGVRPTGTFADPQFKRNQIEARRTMKRVGYYHFSHPDGGESGTEQARSFAKIVGPLQYNEFMVLDFERRDLPKNVVVKFWSDFLTELERITGRRPWVYTSASLADQYELGKYFNRYPLWVVWYVTKDKPKLPKGWNSWQLWQYTSKGAVTGVASSGVDMNIAGAGFMGPSLMDFLLIGGIVFAGLRYLHGR